MKLEILINLIFSFTNLIFVQKFVHVFQLKSYAPARYAKYILKKQFLPLICGLLCFLVCLFLNFWYVLLILNSLLFVYTLPFNLHLNISQKTPLNKTSRCKRIVALSCLICAVCGLIKFGYILSCLILNFVPIIANAINVVDYVKNKRFISKAQQKLKNSNCKIIAITGSNGKTSVKNILKSMLSTTYSCQCTPASFNTPLGISKFINNELNLNTQFLILEYGARHVGDIKKLTKLFGANFGLVTTISAQHMETFKTINNVYKAKQQLPAYLKNNLCVFNADNIFTQKMAQEKFGNKLTISKNFKADVYATDIKFENFKTTFKINTSTTSFEVSTNLLGQHNITNILLSTALALNLGVTEQNIKVAISKLAPTPHRLELIKTHINILDDSYNCSISSAKEALKVLKLCPGKHMVATPGIIEGGTEEHELNFKLGIWCATFDYVVIINKHNRQSLLEGIRSVDATKKVLFANTLEQAKQHFNLLNSGDTLLLLNDLPDDYT